MPGFEPFRGLRYDTGAVRLNEVIAPPYDVVPPSERARLATRHPANAVLVELPEADPPTRKDRYQVAAELLSDWQKHRILVRDDAPSFYAYRMTAPDDTTSMGVIGALALPDPAADGAQVDVVPHEETLPKPKSDRLDLLRATHANLSPIWGLSLTPGLTASLTASGPPAGDAYDDDGVRHQLWVLSDDTAVDAVRHRVASSPIVIADGHHRYETARAYQRERRAATGNAPGPYDFVMALVTELADEQLSVGSIHRLLNGVSEDDVAGALSKWFEIQRAGQLDNATVEALADTRALALLTSEAVWLLTPRPETEERAGGELDSHLLSLVAAEMPELTVDHVHSWQEATEAVQTGRAQGAVLIRPVTVAQIAEWAAARRRMPPKTTYFWPKPRTGMVFRLLDEGPPDNTR